MSEYLELLQEKLQTNLTPAFKDICNKLFPRTTALGSLLARNHNNFRHDFISAFHVAEKASRLASAALADEGLHENGSVYKMGHTALEIMFSQANAYAKMKKCSLKEAWRNVVAIELRPGNGSFELGLE